MKPTYEQLVARVSELEEAAAKKGGKGRQQAEQAVALLQKGPVSKTELSAINPKYPSDPIFYARTLLGAEIGTIRQRGKETMYALVKP